MRRSTFALALSVAALGWFRSVASVASPATLGSDWRSPILVEAVGTAALSARGRNMESRHVTIAIYLAGPEVFLPDLGRPVFEAKKRLCAQYGFRGVAPIDDSPDLAALSPVDQGVAIYRALVPQMQACGAVIANMTPFRGVSMDVGTAFEMGFMAALGKPVLGYSHVVASYAERAAAYYREAAVRPDAYTGGTSIESFDMPDNLMMVSAVLGAGFEVATAAVAPGEELTSLAGFAMCLQALARTTGNSRAVK